MRVCIDPCGLAQVRNVAGEFMQVVEAASGRQPSSGKASSGQGVVRMVAKIVRALRWMGALAAARWLRRLGARLARAAARTESWC
jgi:hypothetical protein